MPERRYILFDGDNTLWEINDIYGKQINLAVDILGQNRDRSAINTDFRRWLNESYPVVHVNPDRQWPYVLSRVREAYQLADSVVQEAFSVLMSIYAITPEIYPDVFETLDQLKSEGYEMGMGSHGKPRWVKDKLRWTGLDKYFPNPKTISVDGPKSANNWRYIRKHYKLPTADSAVVGDGLESDIVAAYDSGIRKLVWVDRPSSWSLHRKGTLPLVAKTVKQLAELPPVLEQLFAKIG